ncbi:DUF1456 family protein [Marinomonas agarivorans]|nr:DUF1456 family protein [Marinomonas agarivorans]
MTNNDVLRRLRYILDFNDQEMVTAFAHADYQASRTEVIGLLKEDSDSEFIACNDRLLATFLNGLITLKRGEKEGTKPEPENRLNNNLILVKLKIAFSLTSDDIIELMTLAEFRISKHELSAFFRKPDHKHFRPCKDQILRQFLKGLQRKYRG